MPKYYCDYCDTYLTHDSPSVRKTHCGGRKHKENVCTYYEKWLADQVQKLVDDTTAAFKAGKIQSNPFANVPGAGGAMIPPPASLTAAAAGRMPVTTGNRPLLPNVMGKPMPGAMIPPPGHPMHGQMGGPMGGQMMGPMGGPMMPGMRPMGGGPMGGPMMNGPMMMRPMGGPGPAGGATMQGPMPGPPK